MFLCCGETSGALRCSPFSRPAIIVMMIIRCDFLALLRLVASSTKRLTIIVSTGKRNGLRSIVNAGQLCNCFQNFGEKSSFRALSNARRTSKRRGGSPPKRIGFAIARTPSRCCGVIRSMVMKPHQPNVSTPCVGSATTPAAATAPTIHVFRKKEDPPCSWPHWQWRLSNQELQLNYRKYCLQVDPSFFKLAALSIFSRWRCCYTVLFFISNDDDVRVLCPP